MFGIERLRERTEYVPQQYEIEKITRKASDVALRVIFCNYVELFGSSARDRYARRRI